MFCSQDNQVFVFLTILCTLFIEQYMIACTCEGTHLSEFTCAIYCTPKAGFSLFVLLLYISCIKNVPKCGVHLAWKDILFELLG